MFISPGGGGHTYFFYVLSLLLLQQAVTGCPDDWTAYGEYCYRAIIQNEPFDNVYMAREACLDNLADLVTIENSTVEEFIFSLMLNQTAPIPTSTYIGLTDIHEEGNFTWLDGTPANYTNFAGSQPDNFVEYNGEHCTAMFSSDSLWTYNGNTGWYDVPCCFREVEIQSAVCRKPVGDDIIVPKENNTIHSECFGNCPPNWYKFDDKCFTLLDTSDLSTYNSTVYARDVCQSEQADLPSVTSQGVGFHLTSILRQGGGATDSIYLGINDVQAEGKYAYLDGSSLMVGGYSNWEGGSLPLTNSSVNCVVLSSDDRSWSNNSNVTMWRDINCCSDQGVSWVMCERPELSAAAIVERDQNVFARDCFLHLNECDSNPCHNGATCEDHVMYYDCECVPGYTGQMCETLIDFCDDDPCKNGATCTPLVNGYNCTCTPGYNGTDCEELYDHCLAFENCENNSTCINHVTHSNCTCLPGFTGDFCEINIDDCALLNITCENNGTCEDGIETAKCNCIIGFGGDRCENELTCPTNALEVANSTQVNNTGNKVGDFVKYDCFPGHKFPGMERSKTLTCMEEGWNDGNVNLPLPACERHCDFLPEVSFSTVDNPNTKVGQVVNYTCLTGFKLADNSTGFNITCQENGNWSLPIDEIPQCEVVTCPELPEYDHQTLKTRNNTYNTTVVFWCDVGYVLHDNTTARTIKCLKDGDWTATLPPCQPVECPVIPELAGLKRNTYDNTYNTYAKFTCESGLRMDDGATYRIIKCDATGEWSDDVTMCGDDRCFPLPYVANATPSDTLAIFGHEVKLSCIPGHRFNQTDKSKNMSCEVTSRWSPLLSSCEPVYCDPVPSNINSSPNTTNTLFGTVVDISCAKGHYFPDDTSSIITQCMDSETWNITEVDPCWPIVCPPRPMITNGVIQEEPPNYNYSQQVKYECIAEHKFIDGNRKRIITCNEFGQWDLTDVSCRKERCDPVPVAFKAVPDTTNTSWDTIVNYQCDTGYHWDDRLTYTILCTRTGIWNDTAVPICIINECDPVPQMNNATTNDTAHVYNTYIDYECDAGFKYFDEERSKSRWCSPDKIWEPVDFPSCDIINCPELPDIENATKNSNETEYQTEVTYDCEPGYQFPDKDRFKIISCTANETWTEQHYTFCEVVFCPPVPYWDATFNSTDNEFYAVVTYKCKSGYAFEDSNRDVTVEKIAKCIEAKIWEPAIQSCVPLESIAKDLQGVVYESEDAVPIGTIACTLMCLLLAAIILLDLHKLLQDLKMMKRNIQSMLDDRNNKVSDSSQDIKTAAAESVA